MRLKRLWILLCSFTLMTSVIFTGCSSSNNTGGNSASEAESTTNEETTIFGQISSIDGNTITIALAEQRQMPSGGSTDMPQRPSGDSTEMPEMPEGSEMPQMPEGSTEMPGMPDGSEMPQRPDADTVSGASGGMGGLNLTGEEQTITVDDSTVITVNNGGESTEGTVSDLTAEDIVTVVLKGDKVVSITAGMGRAGGGDIAPY